MDISILPATNPTRVIIYPDKQEIKETPLYENDISITLNFQLMDDRENPSPHGQTLLLDTFGALEFPGEKTTMTIAAPG